jgi:hypothetical protein
VQAERGPLGQHAVAGREEGLAQHLDDGFRAVADHDLLYPRSGAFGDGGTQRRAVGIGIGADVQGQVDQRTRDGGTGAERVLVAGQARNIDHAIA